MEITVVKEFSFAASHFLPNHPGKCQNLHGHTYKLQVGVRGKVDPETGMVVDFGDLKEMVEGKIIEKLDHRHLNAVGCRKDDCDEDLQSFPRELPTAEMMVEWIIDVLGEYLMTEWEDLVKLCFVRLYESPLTPVAYAEWRGVF
jgi:6-pyruvoyltetrahydropterin/6-carboxytetrahydropterin synthase